MNNYHFSLGNSNTGPIGYCARVNAETKEEAIQKLKTMLEDVAGCEMDLSKWLNLRANAPEIEYFAVYVNPAKLTIRSIDEWEKVPDAAKAN